MKTAWSVPALVTALAACGSDSSTAPPTFAQQMCIRGTIAIGDNLNGTLASSDCDAGDSYFESYRFTVAADTTIDIGMTSGVLDTYVILLRVRAETIDSLDLVAFDDDGGGGTNSLISSVTLSASDDYLVIANGFDYSDVGAYTLSVIP